MKTFQEFITEKWSIDLYKGTKPVPVYENPTTSDLVALKKSGLIGTEIRFIAVNTSKIIFIWDAYKFIHSEVLKKLKEEKKVPGNISVQNLNDTLCGECNLSSGSLTFAKNDGMDSYFGDIIDVLKENEKFYKEEQYFFPDPYKTPFDLINDIDTIISRYHWVEKTIDLYKTHSSPALIKKYYNNYKYRK